MKLASIIKIVVRVAPVVIAQAPAVIAAVREAKRAAKRPGPPPVR